MVENQLVEYEQCNVSCGKWADSALDRFSALQVETGRTLLS